MSFNFEPSAPMSAQANEPISYFSPELELSNVSEETHEIVTWQEFRRKEPWAKELLDLLGSTDEDLDPNEEFVSFGEFNRALKAGHDVRYIIRNSPKPRKELMAILRKFLERDSVQRRNPPKWMARAKMHTPIVVGKAKDIFIMPRSKCLGCCHKPVRYEQHTFLRWATHVCAHLYEQCSRTEHVIANDAAYVLLRGRVMASEKETAHLLQQACFHVMTSEALFDKDVQLGNVNYVNRWISLGPLCIVSQEELESIGWAFKDDKPLWRAAQVYMTSTRLPRDFDVDRFHAGLRKRIFPKITSTKALQALTQYQGAAQSVASEPGVFQRAGSDFSRGVVSYLQSEEFIEFATELSRQFIAWSTMVSLLVDARSAGEAMKILLLRVSADKPLYDAMVAWAVLPQSGEDEHLAKTVVMSIFATVKSFLGDAYEHLIPSFQEVCAATKFAGLKELGMSIIATGINMLVEFLHRVKACVEQKSLRPLFGVDAVRWLRHTKGMIVYFNFIVGANKPKDDIEFQRLRREDQLPTDMCKHIATGHLLTMMQEHLEQAEKLKHCFSGPGLSEFMRTVNQLEMFIHDQHLIVENRYERIAPFMIEFFGPPGRGKSVYMMDILTHLLRRQNWERELIYTYLPQNFQTGLRADTKAVFFDDPDKNPAPPVAGVPSFIDEIMRLGGNQTYEVEQAAVDDKGKVCAAPAVVGITTNFADLKAQNYLRDPRAAWRRISWYITSRVKPEYALPNGMLNHLAAPPSEHSVFDIGRFAYDDAKPQQFGIEWVHKDQSFAQLLAFLREEYDRWHFAQSRLLVRTRCSECGLVEDMCVCKAVLQGARCSRVRCGRAADAYANTLNYLNATSGVGALSVLSAGFLALLIRGIAQFQGREAGVGRDGWWRAQAVKDPTLPPAPPSTWSEEQLLSEVQKCFFTLRGSCELHAVVLKNGYILFPTHVWDKNGHCEGTFRGVRIRLTRDASGVSVCQNAELTIAYVASLTAFNGIWSYVLPDTTSAFDLGAGKFVTSEKVVEVQKVKAGRLNGCSTWVYDPITVDGDCGGLIVARVPGGGVYVVSMHIALQPVPALGNTLGSHGVPIVRRELEQIMARSTFPVSVYQGAFVRNKPIAPALEHYPPVSEVSVALTYYNANVLGWGTLPGNVGMTSKTQMRPTAYHDDVHIWAEEQQLFHDFTIPEFRGKMVGDEGSRVWSSPWTYALEDGNITPFWQTGSVQWYIDRCENFRCEPLTEKQALQGIPGLVNSINMRTSIGPPLFGPKHQEIDRDLAEVAPRLAEELDFIEECLAARRVPIAYGYCTLKDEILKRDKPARIFTNLTAAFNIKLKQYSHPFKQWAREFPALSCIWVGIDCGSAKITDLIDVLRRHKYFYDGDIKKMDKSFSPELWDSIIEAMTGVTCKIAGDECALRLRLLLLGLKDFIANVKGDLFSPFWNPSGNDLTVEINTVGMVLIFVEVFLCQGLSLREISAMTIVGYGDDNVIATDKPLLPAVTQLFRQVSGMVLTDASKKTELEVKDLTQIQFLKRSFRFDEEVGEWMAPLEETSLIKMLLYRGRTTLSVGDYDAELLSTAMRYALLRGRESFHKWESFCLALAEKYQLLDNPRLIRYNYDEFAKAYVSGVFTDWLPFDPRHT